MIQTLRILAGLRSQLADDNRRLAEALIDKLDFIDATDKAERALKTLTDANGYIK